MTVVRVMAAWASMRWGAFRSVATAMRSASAPGSPGVLARLAALVRMVPAVLRGEYQGTGAGHLLLMLGAVGYVLSPLDLMPEALLMIAGPGDDALVITWLAVTLIYATDDFLGWERQRRRTARGEVIR